MWYNPTRMSLQVVLYFRREPLDVGVCMTKVVSRPVPAPAVEGLSFKLNLASVFGALVVAGMIWLIKTTNDGATSQAVMKSEVAQLRYDFADLRDTLTAMTGDRFTGRMQSEYAAGIEARMQRLESKVDAVNQGTRLSN
jgi:outer membrane murein-binding lipoprotein Lpp